VRTSSLRTSPVRTGATMSHSRREKADGQAARTSGAALGLGLVRVRVMAAVSRLMVGLSAESKGWRGGLLCVQYIASMYVLLHLLLRCPRVPPGPRSAQRAQSDLQFLSCRQPAGSGYSRTSSLPCISYFIAISNHTRAHEGVFLCAFFITGRYLGGRLDVLLGVSGA
jgi:hypothetical protein